MRVLVAIAVLTTGCVGGGVRARVGPTIDSDGAVTVQAGAEFTFGYAHSTESATMIGGGTGAGSRNPLEATETITYTRLDRHELGYRAGVRFDVPLVGDDLGIWATGALLYPLTRKHSSGGHEKSFQTSTRSSWAIGFETQAGALFDTRTDDERAGDAPRDRFGVGANMTLEWMSFSRMR